MNYKEAYKMLTSEQYNRRNKAHEEGWSFGGEAYVAGLVVITNHKTLETHTGRKTPLKNGGWSKRVKWND